MAALSIMGAAAVPTVSYLTSNSAGIIVSAEAATSDKSSFLENSRYNSKLKAYKVTYNTKYFDKEYCIWRSGNSIVDIKSSNNSVVNVYTRKNKTTGKLEYIFKTLKTSGSATITVKYKNNIDNSSTKTEYIKVNITGLSSNTAVEVGKVISHSTNSSGIESVVASNGKVKVTKFDKYIRINGISAGNSRICIVYNDGMIENLDCTVNAKKVIDPEKVWKSYKYKDFNVRINGIGVPQSWKYFHDDEYYYFAGGYVSKTDYARLCNCVSYEYGGEPSTFEQAKVVEVIMNLCKSENRSIQSCIAYPNRFEGSELYRNYTTILSRVSNNTQAAVQMYFTRPQAFNQGYTCFFGDGVYNYFWQNFTQWQNAWNGNWNNTWTLSNGKKITIKTKQDYINKFYGDKVVSTFYV
jgi:hypothetical protein